ncbi:MAG: 30S ribosomal protein S4e [Candidatus Nezhaarchaeota archaeon]|nr:30S ribosomal protein S4e [Candidatus Nezhaarchaeota archaeon]MCX8141764.1 30S ribosomal protein S4e [Candidatus Nezhaarchaeota archaeon]MDW8050458.1 30S ribosomal protein S4e [Nitrososphaerota archaeon]
MTKKSASTGLKRYAMPAWWPIPVKEHVWAPRPSPGPHSLDKSMPLLIVLRDVLKLAETAREVKYILKSGAVRVDGVVRRDYRFPVGLMDVIEIEKENLVFRALPKPDKFLDLIPIPETEKHFKLCRIENKRTVKGGHIQLNLHDGSNILVKVSDPRNPIEDIYKTFDVIKISLPDRKILEHYRFELGNLALVIGGKKVGKMGRIVEVKGGIMREHKVVTLDDGNERFDVGYMTVFVVGKESPALTLGEGIHVK